MYCNGVLLTKGNSKVSALNVNLKAVESCDCSCGCSVACYATKGHYKQKNVVTPYRNNLRIYKSDPVRYFDGIQKAIDSVHPAQFRWHCSGDIPDKDYIIGIFRIAINNPSVSFLIYTKRYAWINEYLDTHDKPQNLSIVLSAWGTWIPSNPHNLPMTFVDFPDMDESANPLPAEAFLCPGDRCKRCGYKCWHLQNGEHVIFTAHSGKYGHPQAANA